jgi:putative endonuclease
MAENPDGRTITYVGWTRDLDRRLAEHNGKAAGAKTTRGRVWRLAYAEKHRTRNGAMRREYVLKNDRAFRALLRSR